MKTTSKIRNLACAAAIMLASATQAQQTVTDATSNYDQGFRLGFGLSGGYVLDEPFSGLGLGADVRLQYDFSRRLSATLTTGYNYLPIDDDLNKLGYCDISQIPVKAGFKAFIWGDQLYALAEAGAGFTVSKNNPFTENTTLILSPGIGWANDYLDLSLRYEHYTEFETGQIALRLAYGFKL